MRGREVAAGDTPRKESGLGPPPSGPRKNGTALMGKLAWSPHCRLEDILEQEWIPGGRRAGRAVTGTRGEVTVGTEGQGRLSAKTAELTGCCRIKTGKGRWGVECALQIWAAEETRVSLPE